MLITTDFTIFLCLFWAMAWWIFKSDLLTKEMKVTLWLTSPLWILLIVLAYSIIFILTFIKWVLVIPIKIFTHLKEEYFEQIVYDIKNLFTNWSF